MASLGSFGSSGAATDSGSDSGGGAGSGSSGADVSDPPCVPLGEDEFHLIWIANSEQGTVSKIDTRTGVELGRYFASPAELEGDPSRTSVNLEGDVAVAIRDPGGITKIAGEIDHCVDADGNGVIDTSSGPADIRPWGEDECVLWHTIVPSIDGVHGPRPTAWDAESRTNPETGCEVSDARLWTGYLHEDGHGVFLRLDGATGAVLDTVDGPVLATRPYGGAVDSDGNFLVVAWAEGTALMIDGETLEVTDYGNPGIRFYGMALDRNGNLWVADSDDVGSAAHYDRTTGAWSILPGSGGKTRGIMIDEEGDAWAAGNLPCRLVRIDTETQAVEDAAIPLPGCETPVGVSIDADGFVWVVDQVANVAYKVDPVSQQVALTVDGLVGPYTYSDMTGAGLKLVAGHVEG